MQLDLVVLGNLIVDDIVYDNGSTRMCQPGGACLYMGLTAPLWGLQTGLVSAVGNDYPSEWLDVLADRGVHLEGVRRLPSTGLRTWLLYEGAIRRVVHRLEGATHLQASPSADDLPWSWQPRAIHLAPMPFDHQVRLADDVRSRIAQDPLLTLDPFELLTPTNLDHWQNLTSKIDLLFLSQDEMASAPTRLDPLPVLHQLLGRRLGLIFYKQGSRGGIAVRTPSDRLAWTARASQVRDVTGAGDAFAAGVLAGLLQKQALERALEWGVVSASFAIQDQGARGLLEADPEAARGRLHDWFGS